MKKAIILLFSTLFTFHVKAQEHMSSSKPQISGKNCNDLIHYRDTQLVKTWDKTINQYKISSNAISDLNKYKAQLADDNWYATTNLQILTLTLKLTSNTIEDILKIVAPLHASKSAIILAGNKMSRVLGWVKENKELLGSDDVEKDLSVKAAKEIAELSPLMTIPNLLNNLRENLHSMNDYTNVRAEVNLKIANFDSAINKYNIKLNAFQTDLTVINDYKSSIDRYLNENCKNVPASIDTPTGNSVVSSANERLLLVTFQDDNEQWIAMGPHHTSESYPTEYQALDEIFYSSPSVLTFLCKREKFKIYRINDKTEHAKRDVREFLKSQGITNIPQQSN